MNITIQDFLSKRLFNLIVLLIFCCGAAYSQNKLTIVEGIIRDAETKEALPFVSVQFDGTTTGVFSDGDGHYRISTRNNVSTISVSFMGYNKITIPIVKGEKSKEDILLIPDGVKLDDVVVKPKKEKYSKKNNPAVELIKKVIANKDKNSPRNQDYYQYEEFERMLVALDDFKPNQGVFKRMKFLPQYMDTSLIDSKPILPISVRETVTSVYYRKDPKFERRIIEAHNVSGIDQVIETESLDAIINETFKDISIFDDKIQFLFRDFIGPLSSSSAVDFYKWYLNDTVDIANERFVRLDFAPFNSQDASFTGSIYISLDGDYGVRRAELKTPKRINVNFVDLLVVKQDFIRVAPNLWLPEEQTMGMDMSVFGFGKAYVEKTRTYSKIELNTPEPAVYNLEAPTSYALNFDKRTDNYWQDIRLKTNKKNHQMGEMVEDMHSVFLLNAVLKTANTFWTGYIPTSKDEEKNKLNIGKVSSFYSYNSTEGNRFRLTLATTKNFHPRLHLYGYAAYGTRDNKFKYSGEFTWTFKDIRKVKEEFPKNNLTITHQYDLNSLGQKYTQMDRDNILYSFSSSKNSRLTYNRLTEIKYEKEYYNGFLFKVTGLTSKERPAGDLKFEKRDDHGNKYEIGKISTTEGEVAFRYAHDEKFFQHGRDRYRIPAPRMEFDLAHRVSFDNFLGGEYNYNKTTLSVIKDFWMGQYGKLRTNVTAGHIWGKAPFPYLLTPNANTSFTIQRGTFYQLDPLEFVHDTQLTWELYYHMEGWLFNRIPLLKRLKLREVFAFRGVKGYLSKKNNPLYNNDMIILPEHTSTTYGAPYMECNIGIENILGCLRVDYVRRLNYLDHPDAKKGGFRISFDVRF